MTTTKPKKLTDEQKAKFGPMLEQTYQAIGPDVAGLISDGKNRVAEIVEITCDANRPEIYGGMNKQEYAELMAAYNHPDTKRWLRSVLNY